MNLHVTNARPSKCKNTPNTQAESAFIQMDLLSFQNNDLIESLISSAREIFQRHQILGRDIMLYIFNLLGAHDQC